MTLIKYYDYTSFNVYTNILWFFIHYADNNNYYKEEVWNIKIDMILRILSLRHNTA